MTLVRGTRYLDFVIRSSSGRSTFVLAICLTDSIHDDRQAQGSLWNCFGFWQRVLSRYEIPAYPRSVRLYQRLRVISRRHAYHRLNGSEEWD